jgi:hypothetical protein
MNKKMNWGNTELTNHGFTKKVAEKGKIGSFKLKIVQAVIKHGFKYSNKKLKSHEV